MCFSRFCDPPDVGSGGWWLPVLIIVLGLLHYHWPTKGG